jgi:hypothetical protein
MDLSGAGNDDPWKGVPRYRLLVPAPGDLIDFLVISRPLSRR